MADPRPPVQERSYGIVLIRPPPAAPTSLQSQDVEVLLIRQRPKPGPLLPHSGQTFVALPKGHREPADESDLAAALRELREETGLGVARVLCDGRTIKERYANPRNGREKENTFWVGLVEGDGEAVSVQVEEVEGAEWVRLDEAEGRVTYEETKGLLREARRMLVEGS